MTGQTCRVCGCVDEAIKPTCQFYSFGMGCHWVETDLCSTCGDLLTRGHSETAIREANARGDGEIEEGA